MRQEQTAGRLGGVTMGVRKLVVLASLLCAAVLAVPPRSSAQVNTVNLSGTVLDPQNLAVKDAKLTLQNSAKGVTRTAMSDANGRYELVGLSPGTYTLTVEAAGFAILTDTSFTLTLGQVAEYSPQLQLKTSAESVSVTAAPDLVETSKTDVSMTVSQNQIDNLPINGRELHQFHAAGLAQPRATTRLRSAQRPTTGLNFGGQRGRSNEISVDGADAIDNSVNGVRATVSQEAVQEFQVITSNYMPEYGRAMGGVVNIVTKSGTNQVHGNVFGFLRRRRSASAGSIFRRGRIRSRYRIGGFDSGKAILHARAGRRDPRRADPEGQDILFLFVRNDRGARRPDSPTSARTTSDFSTRR